MRVFQNSGTSLDFFERADIDGQKYKQELDKSEKGCYVYDAKNDILCIVEFGNHLIGILFILRYFYNFSFGFPKEKEKEYHNIINTFELKGAWKLPQHYAEDVAYDGDWVTPELEEEN